MIFTTLSEWHRELLTRMLQASFPGAEELRIQADSAQFSIIDSNRSLKIEPTVDHLAAIEKTIPVEAWASDTDGIQIQILLYTNKRKLSMMEVLREDGEPVQKFPPASAFDIVVLGR